MPEMDESTLVRDLLERATTSEPPIGPMTQNALRQGIGLRRRRRVRFTVAASAVVCAAALTTTSALGTRPAADGNKGATVYVLGTGMTHDTVTPISAATNTPGQSIALRSGTGSGSPGTIPTARYGKTIYVFDGASAVLPIAAATNRAARPIEVMHNSDRSMLQLVVAPDRKTVYVLDSGLSVTPISTATNRPGKPVELGRPALLADMAITPDGRTLYVAIYEGEHGSYVIPIDTADNTPGKRILVSSAVNQIVAAPDGKTVYLIGNIGDEMAVTPIPTATNKPGRRIIVGNGNVTPSAPVIMTPNGQTIYIPYAVVSGVNINRMDVVAFATATNRPGKLISLDALSVDGMAITPNGRTLYVATQPPGTQKQVSAPGDTDAYSCISPRGEVTPIATATNTAGRPIRVGCRPLSIAITPDGKTIYVGASSNTVTPIDTATDHPGTPVEVLQPEAIVITP